MSQTPKSLIPANHCTIWLKVATECLLSRVDKLPLAALHNWHLCFHWSFLQECMCLLLQTAILLKQIPRDPQRTRCDNNGQTPLYLLSCPCNTTLIKSRPIRTFDTTVTRLPLSQIRISLTPAHLCFLPFSCFWTLCCLFFLGRGGVEEECIIRVILGATTCQRGAWGQTQWRGWWSWPQRAQWWYSVWAPAACATLWRGSSAEWEWTQRCTSLTRTPEGKRWKGHWWGCLATHKQFPLFSLEGSW